METDTTPKPDLKTDSPDVAGCPAPICSDSDDERWDDDPDDQCHFCCGDGYVDGEELGDPGWYLPGEIYKCTCCGGSGQAKDCTFW